MVVNLERLVQLKIEMDAELKKRTKVREQDKSELAVEIYLVICQLSLARHITMRIAKLFYA